MYVYVKNGRIRLKSEERMHIPWTQEYVTDHKMTDRLILEWWGIKIYEQSKQYAEDTNRYHLEKELKSQKKKNKELETIANAKVQKELELDVKWQTADNYQRKIYLLKNMREWLQHLWWQETE